MALNTERFLETAAAALTLLLAWSLPLSAEGPGEKRPNLWVLTDDNNGTTKLELITARGDRLFSTTSVFGRGLTPPPPTAVVTDGSDGGLWGTDFNNGRLFKLSRSGPEQLEIAVHELHLQALGADSLGERRQVGRHRPERPEQLAAGGGAFQGQRRRRVPPCDERFDKWRGMVDNPEGRVELTADRLNRRQRLDEQQQVRRQPQPVP